MTEKTALYSKTQGNPIGRRLRPREPGEGGDNYPEVPSIKNGSCTSLSCHVVPRDKHYKTLVDTMIKAITSNGRITRISIIVRYDIFIQLETTC